MATFLSYLLLKLLTPVLLLALLPGLNSPPPAPSLVVPQTCRVAILDSFPASPQDLLLAAEDELCVRLYDQNKIIFTKLPTVSSSDKPEEPSKICTLTPLQVVGPPASLV